MGIKPRTGRGQGFALEWPTVGGCGRRAVGGIQAAISDTDFKGNSRHNSGEGDAIPLLIWLFPVRYTRAGYVFVALGWGLPAKAPEVGFVDHAVYAAGHLVRGRTLRRLAAAAGAFWLFLLVEYCRPAATAG